MMIVPVKHSSSRFLPPIAALNNDPFQISPRSLSYHKKICWWNIALVLEVKKIIFMALLVCLINFYSFSFYRKFNFILSFYVQLHCNECDENGGHFANFRKFYNVFWNFNFSNFTWPLFRKFTALLSIRRHKKLILWLMHSLPSCTRIKTAHTRLENPRKNFLCVLQWQ